MPKKVKNKWIRRSLYTLLGIFVFIILTFIVLWYLYSHTSVLERAAMDYLNLQLKGKGTVTYSAIRGSLLNQIEIDNLQVIIQDQAQIDCNYLEIHYDLWRLIHNEIKVSKILLDKLSVKLIAQADEKDEEEQKKKRISVDTTLIKIENSNFVDNILNSVPVIKASDLDIVAAAFRIADTDINITGINLSIDNISINKKSFDIKLDQLSGAWVNRDIHLMSTSFVLKGNREHISLNRLEAATEKSKFACSAYYDLTDSTNADIDFYDFYFDMDEAAKITRVEELKGGFVKGRWNFSGEPTNFIFNLNLNGAWQGRKLQSLDTEIMYNEGLIKVNRLAVQSNAGNIDVNGRGWENKGAYGNIRLKHINLSEIMPDLVKTDLNGLFQFDFDVLHLTRPTGAGSLTLYQSEVDSVRFDSLRLALQAKSGNWQIDKPSYIQFRDSSRFDLEGRLARDKEIDLTFSTYNSDLSALSETFHLDTLFGKFDLQMRAMGSIEDPNISGVVILPYFRMDSTEFFNISLHTYIEQILSRRNGELVFEIDTGSVASIPFNDIKISANSLKNQVEIENLQMYSRNNFLNAAAKIYFAGDSIRLTINKFKAEYEKYWLKNIDDITIVYDSTGIILRSLNLEAPQSSR
ncbi:MAG: hypothetical protein P8X42_10240, partial [Calditrichaceae bacterium]